MRWQAWHNYINQYYNYKKFVGLDIIYKFNKHNYICIKPFKEGKKTYLMLFPNDGKSCRDYVIQRVLNIVNNINLEKQVKAVQEMLEQSKKAALA